MGARRPTTTLWPQVLVSRDRTDPIFLTSISHNVQNLARVTTPAATGAPVGRMDLRTMSSALFSPGPMPPSKLPPTAVCTGVHWGSRVGGARRCWSHTGVLSLELRKWRLSEGLRARDELMWRVRMGVAVSGKTSALAQLVFRDASMSHV